MSDEMELTRRLGHLEREHTRWILAASFLGCVVLMLAGSLVYAAGRIGSQAETIADLMATRAAQAETYEGALSAWEGEAARAQRERAEAFDGWKICEGQLYSAGLEIERLGLTLGREPLPDDEATECQWAAFVLGQRLDVCRRDRRAAQCALGGEPGCDPTRVDFGGVVNARD